MTNYLKCSYCKHDLTSHEIGVLFASCGKLQANTDGRFGYKKLTNTDANVIRKSNAPIRELAGKYNVSFSTIWRIKNYLTYTGQESLNCPHCGHELTASEVYGLFSSLGGRSTSPKKKMAALAGGRAVAKLTQKDADKIRKSNEPSSKLAQKYKVSYDTIWRIKKNRIWKSRA